MEAVADGYNIGSGVGGKGLWDADVNGNGVNGPADAICCGGCK